MIESGKFYLLIIFFLSSLFCIPLSTLAECPEDDEDCRLRENGIILNRHVLEDPIYRIPAVPLLTDPSARSAPTVSPGQKKIKPLDSNKGKSDKPISDLLIEIPQPADETIQNVVQQNQILQEHAKNKSDPKPDLRAAPDLRLEFPVDSSQLNQRAQDFLNQLGLMLKNNSKFHVNLYGYAHVAIQENSQMRLGFDRVQAVKVFLNQVGIEPERLHLYVIGESNNPPYDRVDVIIVKD